MEYSNARIAQSHTTQPIQNESGKRHIASTDLYKMKPTISSADSSGMLLTGTVFLANFDYSGFADYAIKAAIGGVVWMCFKLSTDYISLRMRNKNNQQK